MLMANLTTKSKAMCVHSTNQSDFDVDFSLWIQQSSHTSPGSMQPALAGRWQMGNKRDLMFTVNFKGCKYYEDVMCMTAKGMRNQISVLKAEVHFNVSCEVS